MNAIGRCDAAARERHRALDFIGLRAHATTVGLIQLCEELLNSGVLSPEGLERIKGAIRTELTVSSNARISNHAAFDDTLPPANRRWSMSGRSRISKTRWKPITAREGPR